MTRSYPYRITLRFYSGRTERHHIHAMNRSDAFNKAHRFSDPIACTCLHDGVQFIDVQRITKQYCTEHSIRFE